MADENLDDLTKAELQDKADELEIEWSESDTKADLITAITDAESGVDEQVAADEEAGPTGPVASYPSETNPERRPVEVDLANVPVEEHEGEVLAPLNAESWVVLDGSHPDVDPRWDGAVAGVIDWPTAVEHDTNTGATTTYLPPDAHLTVKERSQGAMFYLPLDAFKEIHTNGRPAVLGFA